MRMYAKEGAPRAPLQEFPFQSPSTCFQLGCLGTRSGVEDLLLQANEIVNQRLPKMTIQRPPNMGMAVCVCVRVLLPLLAVV